jgi:hypothetical protein
MAMAGEATSDGATAPHDNISFFNAYGADDAAMADPQGIAQSYLFFAGSALSARTSSQSVSYISAGCIATNGAVTTDLQLPDGADVQGVRMFYYNQGQAGDVTAFLTSYDGAGGLVDHLAASSTMDEGYASEYFALTTPLVVDAFTQSLVLTANIDAGLRLCGLRVFYAAP